MSKPTIGERAREWMDFWIGQFEFDIDAIKLSDSIDLDRLEHKERELKIVRYIRRRLMDI